jgi:hypothetical protein
MNRYDAEFSTDARQGDVAFTTDFRPTTLLEENLMGGYTRTTMPVGEGQVGSDEFQSTGGRGTGDAIDAIRIGANGRKR